jgi:hypothetical protein
MSFPAGKEVIGRSTNAAINAAAVELAFKDVNGATHTFAAGERLIIREITVNNRATAKDVTIFQDTDAGDDLDAAETIQVFSFAAAGYIEYFSDGLATNRINTSGTNTIQAIASAVGSVDIMVRGEVVKS